MRYRIEYLAEIADEHSVCYARVARAKDLDGAEREAREGSFRTRHLFKARGFQIRDMNHNWKVVALEPFEDAPDPPGAKS